MPHQQLPKNPSLTHLRHQARDLMRGQSAGDLAVLQRIREFHPAYRGLTDAEIVAKPLKLSDAQFTLAREYTFASWPELKASIESHSVPDPDTRLEDRIVDPAFREGVRLIDSGDVDGMRALLAANPSLVRQHVYFHAGDYFGRPGLLQFVAENPIRQESMPNALAIARVILDAEPSVEDMTDTLGLVMTGRVPREQGVQVALIELLCAAGARIHGLAGALAHAEFQAVEALLRLGAPLTLEAAAALGREQDFQRLLPTSTPAERHLALAFAAQFGRVTILKMLLEAGEDPNRYNPPGAHAHSTPLHQAVIHGQGEAVKLLLTAGARQDIPDTMWHGTPLGWAEHENLPEMAALLRPASV